MKRIFPSSWSSFRATGLLVGHLRGGAVQLVEVDALERQPAQAALACLAGVFGTGVARPPIGAGALEAALRSDDEPLGGSSASGRACRSGCSGRSYRGLQHREVAVEL